MPSIARHEMGTIEIIRAATRSPAWSGLSQDFRKWPLVKWDPLPKPFRPRPKDPSQTWWKVWSSDRRACEKTTQKTLTFTCLGSRSSMTCCHFHSRATFLINHGAARWRPIAWVEIEKRCEEPPRHHSRTPAKVSQAGVKSCSPPIRGYFAKGKFVQVDTLFVSRHKSISRATQRIWTRFFAGILRKMVSPTSPSFIIFLQREVFFLFFPKPENR